MSPSCNTELQKPRHHPQHQAFDKSMFDSICEGAFVISSAPWRGGTFHTVSFLDLHCQEEKYHEDIRTEDLDEKDNLSDV